MRAVIYANPGDTSVLQFVERPPGEPAEGEVRIRVIVSGVNPTDWKSRSGAFGGAAAAEPTVPNHDGAGTVDAVGPGVAGIQPGDRVWVTLAGDGRPASGTAQEYTVVPAERVFPRPDGADFGLGASIGIPGVTAHRALTVSDGGPARLEPGALQNRTVLVAGGAGAVGNAAIQLARWAGATVIATVSGEAKAELAARAGAHHVVGYRDPGAAGQIRRIAPAGVDVIVEVAAGSNAELDMAVLREHKPRDRRAAVHQPTDRRVPPAQGVPQARRQHPQGSARRAHGRVRSGRLGHRLAGGHEDHALVEVPHHARLRDLIGLRDTTPCIPEATDRHLALRHGRRDR